MRFWNYGLFMYHVLFYWYSFKHWNIEFLIDDKLSHNLQKIRCSENIFNLKSSLFHIYTVKINFIQLLGVRSRQMNKAFVFILLFRLFDDFRIAKIRYENSKVKNIFFFINSKLLFIYHWFITLHQWTCILFWFFNLLCCGYRVQEVKFI